MAIDIKQPSDAFAGVDVVSIGGAPVPKPAAPTEPVMQSGTPTPPPLPAFPPVQLPVMVAPAGKSPLATEARGSYVDHAKRLATELKDRGWERSALFPVHDTPTRFRAGGFTHDHQRGLSITTQHAPNTPIVPEIFEAVGKLDSRVTLVPQIYSEVLKSNVRFAMVLPPRFDAQRKTPYDVVAVVSSHPLNTTIAYQVMQGTLHTKIDTFLHLAEVPDAIAVMVDGAQNPLAVAPEKTAALAKAGEVIERDILPYLRSFLNVESTVIGTMNPEKVTETALAMVVGASDDDRVDAEPVKTETVTDGAKTDSGQKPKKLSKKQRKQERERANVDARLTGAQLRATKLAGALVPKDGLLGFDFKALGVDVKYGFDYKFYAVPETVPHRALLKELSRVPRRVAFIPEMRAQRTSTNIRFAVILPPGYDPDASKKYPVVKLLCGSFGDRVGARLQDDAFATRLEDMLKAEKLENAIVVISDEQGSVSGPAKWQYESSARLVYGEILGYVDRHFAADVNAGGNYDGQTLKKVDIDPDIKPVLGPARDVPKSTYVPGPGSTWRPQTTTTPSAPALTEALKSTPSPVVYVEGSFARVKSASPAFIEEARKSLKKVPDRIDTRVLSNTTTPTVMLSSVADGSSYMPFALVVPAGFEVGRKKPYDIVTLVSGEKLADVLAKLGEASRPDTIIVVPDVEAVANEGRALELVREQALAAITKESWSVDFERYGVVRSAAGQALGDTKQLAVAQERIDGMVLNIDGHWRRMPPSSDEKQSLKPVDSHVDKIPVELQKQSATQGSFFAPVIDSKKIKERIRCGIFLPPGYDPASAERYPVLIMLPGRGNALTVWTNVGKIIPKLNHMMAGDAQKLIVLIPDNTDSFWVNYDALGDVRFGNQGKRAYEDVVMEEMLGYVTNELKGDASQLSILGISRGGFGAASLAMRNPSKFKSLSTHAGVLTLGGGEATMFGTGEHFGPASNRKRDAFNPTKLVEAGALQKGAPAIYLDVGSADNVTGDDTLRFSRLLDEQNVKHEITVHERQGAGELKHNWDTWAPMIETWVAFHQRAYGKPGVPRAPSDFVDIAPKAKVAQKAAEIAAQKAAEERAKKEAAEAAQKAAEEAAKKADREAADQRRADQKAADKANKKSGGGKDKSDKGGKSDFEELVSRPRVYDVTLADGSVITVRNDARKLN